MPQSKLLNALKSSKSDKTRIEKIRKVFKKLQYKFSKSKIKAIRKSCMK